MVQENETPVTQDGVAEAQTEVPAKEDAVVATEGSAEQAPHEPPQQQQQQRPRALSRDRDTGSPTDRTPPA